MSCSISMSMTRSYSPVTFLADPQPDDLAEATGNNSSQRNGSSRYETQRHHNVVLSSRSLGCVGPDGRVVATAGSRPPVSRRAVASRWRRCSRTSSVERGSHGEDSGASRRWSSRGQHRRAARPPVLPRVRRVRSSSWQWRLPIVRAGRSLASGSGAVALPLCERNSTTPAAVKGREGTTAGRGREPELAEARSPVPGRLAKPLASAGAVVLPSVDPTRVVGTATEAMVPTDGGAVRPLGLRNAAPQARQQTPHAGSAQRASGAGGSVGPVARQARRH